MMIFKNSTSKIIEIEYELYQFLNQKTETENAILENLKQIILLLEQLDKQLPIFDFSTKREIDPQKVLQFINQKNSKF